MFIILPCVFSSAPELRGAALETPRCWVSCCRRGEDLQAYSLLKQSSRHTCSHSLSLFLLCATRTGHVIYLSLFKETMCSKLLSGEWGAGREIGRERDMHVIGWVVEGRERRKKKSQAITSEGLSLNRFAFWCQPVFVGVFRVRYVSHSDATAAAAAAA